MRRLVRASLALSAFMSLACTVANPRYCASETPTHECRDAGSSKDANVAEVGVGRDAKEGGGDTHVETAPEVTPVCTRDSDCPADGGMLACDTSGIGARCVQCVDSKQHCTDPKKPVCDAKVHQCVECVGTGTECTAEPGKSVCNVAAQQCVECLDDTKCGGTRPICDAALKTCRSCAADSECKVGSGICVDFDGHCAPNEQVVFLDRGGTCDPLQSKYCTAASAVAALTAQKPILLISGTMAVGALDISGAAPDPVLIVGKAGTSVGAGSGDNAGVRIAGVRKVWVRDLKISGGTVGVLAEPGADLHLTRCTIVQNMAGGVLTNGASFDITNTIIAGNDQGDQTGGVVWAGARLGDLPPGGKSRFENNTVVDNKQVGISCKTPYDVTTNIIHGNVGGESVNCGTPACCGPGDPDPNLDTTYHLHIGSPCIDKIAATAASLTVDIQGQPRPTPPAGKLDCGADELVP